MSYFFFLNGLGIFPSSYASTAAIYPTVQAVRVAVANATRTPSPTPAPAWYDRPRRNDLEDMIDVLSGRRVCTHIRACKSCERNVSTCIRYLHRGATSSLGSRYAYQACISVRSSNRLVVRSSSLAG